MVWQYIGSAVALGLFGYKLYKNHKFKKETPEDYRNEQIEIGEDISESAEKVEHLFKDVGEMIRESELALADENALIGNKATLITRNFQLSKKVDDFVGKTNSNPENVNNPKSIRIIIEGNQNPARIGSIIYKEMQNLKEMRRDNKVIIKDTMNILRAEKPTLRLMKKGELE